MADRKKRKEASACGADAGHCEQGRVLDFSVRGDLFAGTSKLVALPGISCFRRATPLFPSHRDRFGNQHNENLHTFPGSVFRKPE